MARDFYDLLAVGRDASSKEIQSAYRRLARKYHPDVTGGDQEAEEHFKAVNQAHDVLSDKKKRAAYDRWGDQWMHAEQLEKTQRAGGGSHGVRGPGQGNAWNFEFSGDPSQFEAREFQDGGGGFGQVFERLFRSGGQGAPAARAAAPLTHEVTVSLAEAHQGSTRTVQLQTYEPCATCGGSGSIGAAVCHACQGSGRHAAGRRLEVKIPAGVETGSKIRLRGKGPAQPGGRPGDVVLVITVAADPRFERRGSALHSDVPVPLTTAVLGGEVQVPTVDSSVMLRIPAGTQNGRVFRLAGKGMPVLDQDRRGDLLAKAQVVLPESLTSREQELFEELQRIEGDEAEPDGRRSA